MIWPRIHGIWEDFFEIDPEVSLILSTHMARKPLMRGAHIRCLKWKWITSSMWYRCLKFFNLGQDHVASTTNNTFNFQLPTPLLYGNGRSSTVAVQNRSQLPRDSNITPSLSKNVPRPPYFPVSPRGYRTNTVNIIILVIILSTSQ